MVRTHKWKNVRTKCSSDHMHRSKLEALMCDTIKTLVMGGEIERYDIETRFLIVDSGRYEAPMKNERPVHYYADFVYTYKKNGRRYMCIVDTKGNPTSDYIIKRKLMKRNLVEIAEREKVNEVLFLEITEKMMNKAADMKELLMPR